MPHIHPDVQTVLAAARAAGSKPFETMAPQEARATYEARRAFPAAVEDCAAALNWLAAQASKVGVDRDRIAVGGDSAGGNLAAVLALMSRERALPRVMYQLLLYPAVDLAITGESYGDKPTDGMTITPATMRYFLDHYLPNGSDRADWRASPLRAPTLAGLPPAFVLTCGHDPLEAEGRAYAERLAAEDVP